MTRDDGGGGGYLDKILRACDPDVVYEEVSG